MPMSHLPEIGANKNTGSRKSLPVSAASDVQFGAELFCYLFLATNRIVPQDSADLCYRFSGTSFRRRFLCVMGTRRNLVGANQPRSASAASGLQPVAPVRNKHDRMLTVREVFPWRGFPAIRFQAS